MGMRNYSLRDDRHAAAPQDGERMNLEGKIALMLTNVDVRDVLDELYDARAELDVVLKTGDAALIGRLLLEVRQAYAERLVDLDVYGHPTIAGRSAQEAAAEVLVGVRS